MPDDGKGQSGLHVLPLSDDTGNKHSHQFKEQPNIHALASMNVSDFTFEAVST